MLLMPPMYNFSYGVNNLESHHKRFSCKQLVNCKMVLSNFKPYSEVKENSHTFGDNFRELLDMPAAKKSTSFYKTVNTSDFRCESIFDTFHQFQLLWIRHLSSKLNLHLFLKLQWDILLEIIVFSNLIVEMQIQSPVIQNIW